MATPQGALRGREMRCLRFNKAFLAVHTEMIFLIHGGRKRKNAANGNVLDVIIALVIDNLLVGLFPEFIGSLTNLVHLDLSNTGTQQGETIPYQIGNLSNLQYLNLRVISHELKNLSKLQCLSLSNNYFNGPIPVFIGSLKSYRYHDLSYSGFSGVIPHDLENLSKLQHLDLSYNLVTGGGNFECLAELDLSRNMLEGRIPESFAYMTSLTHLELFGNQLSSVLSEATGLPSSLVELDLSMNSIRSTISEAHLFNISRLEYKHASFNSLAFEFSSECPFQFTQLSLASCKLGPKFPNWIRNQRYIDHLDISNSQISDTIPISFSNLLTAVYHLNLSSNKIRGSFLFDFPYIEEMDLSSNYFDKPLPPIPTNCVKLNLSQNKFSGTLISISVTENLSIGFLDISNNKLFGALPDNWMYFQGLVFLNLGYNNFSGRIPRSIGN
ncbi:hypothetical protein POM88_039914 [Heracleum sosnowskyi]|uniref:Uncharacterized protein n=1 Tax=Heracleum sosnowskyi TaxID=360622 RepID=A0AAD8M9S8_9APIA|nr:hypothetical protein POM88_039914 [Heracleum sosnowskyi]